jgi:hypothetical protein
LRSVTLHPVLIAFGMDLGDEAEPEAAEAEGDSEE